MIALKKFFLVGPASRSELVDIQILSQKMLQPKRQLFVVKVLNKVLVVGSTEHGIQALGEIDDASTVQALEERQEDLRLQKAAARLSFKEKLYQAETLGDFFHKPFNVTLWRGNKRGVGSAIEVGSDVRR
jgi:flagellar biogenesis protein FliO